MELISEYISATHLVAHQIDTLNHFYTKSVRGIVIGAKIVSPHLEAVFTDVRWRLPKRGPSDAVRAGATYSATLLAKLDILDDYVPLCEIPVMVYSDLCIKRPREYGDPGGYFIVRGKERVLISYMRSLHDRIYISPAAGKGRWLFTAEIRSMSDVNSSVLTVARCTATTLALSVPYIKTFVPAGILLRCIGLDKDPAEAVPFLAGSIFCASVVADHASVTRDQALDYIAAGAGLARDYIESILAQGFRPPFYAGDYLVSLTGLFARKFDLAVRGRIAAPPDREELIHKRVDSPGMLMTYLFNGLFKLYVKSVAYAVKSPAADLALILQNKQSITNEIRACFLTGNWVIKKKFGTSFARIGLCQVLTNYNRPARLSHLRRVMHNIGTKGKNYAVRQLHGSHMGMFCPFETPEGERVGLVLNLAVSAEISDETGTDTPLAALNSAEVEANGSFVPLDRRVPGIADDAVFLNGFLVGSAPPGRSGWDLHGTLTRLRAAGHLHPRTTIAWDVKERVLEIFTDAGRLLRPLYDLSVPIVRGESWADAERRGSVVFRSTDEIASSLVAVDAAGADPGRHRFAEIHIAATMTGIMAGLVPFANHTQSPRIIYQASMGKQAMGLPSVAVDDRFDATLNVLDYPQKSLTRTCLAEPLLADEFPSGAMPIVAICTMTGFNQEDSILLNKGSIERGLFQSTTYKTVAVETPRRSKTETLCVPEDAIKRREYNYGFLGDDGILCPVKARGAFLKKGTVLVGKRVAVDGDRFQCGSIALKSHEQGRLDRVSVACDETTGDLLVLVRMRSHRIPEIGDKFSSFTAQKGTCGMIVPQEDMPFDRDGIVPDLIINPHAFPSRMTINYLLQMCCDLFNCSSVPDPADYPREGQRQDASMFGAEPMETRLAGFLKRMGVNGFDSVMYSGTTGKRFPVKIFMAPCPYQRLKHMVADKIYARVSGPIELLTRQPVAGRRRFGGLKTGEMERDCYISHGASMVLREAMFDKSDRYQVAVCDRCSFGFMDVKAACCQRCGDTSVRVVNIPYTTKLLLQQLMGVGIRQNIS